MNTLSLSLSLSLSLTHTPTRGSVAPAGRQPAGGQQSGSGVFLRDSSTLPFQWSLVLWGSPGGRCSVRFAGFLPSGRRWYRTGVTINGAGHLLKKTEQKKRKAYYGYYYYDSDYSWVAGYDLKFRKAHFLL